MPQQAREGGVGADQTAIRADLQQAFVGGLEQRAVLIAGLHERAVQASVLECDLQMRGKQRERWLSRPGDRRLLRQHRDQQHPDPAFRIAQRPGEGMSRHRSKLRSGAGAQDFAGPQRVTQEVPGRCRLCAVGAGRADDAQVVVLRHAEPDVLRRTQAQRLDAGPRAERVQVELGREAVQRGQHVVERGVRILVGLRYVLRCVVGWEIG